MSKEAIYTGLRMEKEIRDQWETLANALGMNLNQTIAFLIKSAHPVSGPIVAFSGNIHTEGNTAILTALDRAYQKLAEYEQFFGTQELRIAALEAENAKLRANQASP